MTAYQNQSRRATPDLIDVFIIILLAGAIDIFIFTIATQFVARNTFQQLPSFLTDAYKAVWASVVSGTAGVGLVIVKSLRSTRIRRPNYLLWVLATAGTSVVAIVLVAILAQILNPRPALTVPPGVALISSGMSAPSTFEFKPLPGAPGAEFDLVGTFAVSSNEVTGELKSGSFTIPNGLKYAPQKISEAAFRVCYLHSVYGADQMDLFPPIAKSENAIPLNIAPEMGKAYTIPPGKFKFQLPSDINPQRAWLCSALNTDFGYIPMQ
ncbi:hypothetical protein [Rhizobium sp. CF142]|uniref:hypothetical protein n=1 Tax=Rhizobium sp. CF142 TaxID=1144314 RepID=UPI00026EFF1D|nr:hypothetical protein [Rhizobium sp. CF142]EJJ28073.1 hypothetical protein PMI11_03677 [Rhizobium sp. CF142]